jgi:SAM-dependent methyltransferase
VTAAATSLPLQELAFVQEAVSTAAALRAANAFGVLARLDEEPRDAATLARACAISERGTRALLGALASVGLVEAIDGGAFRASRDLAGLGPLLTPWDHLTDAIQHGEPAVRGDTPDGAQALYPAVVPQLASWFAEAAECAADVLARPGLRIVDVGAGAAPWSRAIAARDSTCRVTAVDVPAVLQVTRRAVEAAGIGAQFDYRDGDAFAVDLPAAAHDVVILANFCHLFGEPENRSLLGRLLAALRPGGRLAIIDAVPNERGDSPRPVMLYALGLLLRTRRGQVYPFSTYLAWLHDAGYERVERVDLVGGFPITLITARRPGR